MSRFLAPDDGAIPAAAIANFASHVTLMHAYVPDARAIEADDVLIADSSIPDATFNIIMQARFAPDALDRRIAETVAAARATGRPFVWWVDAEGPAGLAAGLDAAGLKASDRSLIMRADLAIETEMRPVDGELEIRLVTTERDFADFAQALAGYWNPPAQTVLEFFGKVAKGLLAPGGSGADAFRTFVGYVRGVPVCVAQAVLADGVAGLYNIVTDTGYRGRGFGAAMTVAAMRAARDEGYRTVVLEASPMGEPVYRRLGFVTCGEVLEYAVEP